MSVFPADFYGHHMCAWYLEKTGFPKMADGQLRAAMWLLGTNLGLLQQQMILTAELSPWSLDKWCCNRTKED